MCNIMWLNFEYLVLLHMNKSLINRVVRSIVKWKQSFLITNISTYGLSIGHLQNELVIEKLCFHYTMLLTILFIIKLFAQSNIFTNKSLSKIQIFNVHKIKQFMSINVNQTNFLQLIFVKRKIKLLV